MHLEMPVDFFPLMVLLFHMLVFPDLTDSGSTFKLPNETQAILLFSRVN